MVRLHTRSIASFFATVICVSLLNGCGTSGIYNPAAAGSNINTNTNTGVAETVTNTDCSTALAGNLSLVSPTLSTIAAGAAATWQVSASGCTGRYMISSMPGVYFTASQQYTQTYANSGTQIESLALSSVDSTGKIIKSMVLSSGSFTVAGNSVPTGAPTCTIQRIPGTLNQAGQALPFMLLAQGSVSNATINGAAVIPGAATFISPDGNGFYTVRGNVTGPGGTNACPIADFQAPQCTLAYSAVTSSSVDLTLSILGTVNHATIDGINFTNLPVPPATSSVYHKVFGVNDTGSAVAVVYSPTGDNTSCSSVYPTAPSKMLAAGYEDFACGLNNGAVECWGYNAYGQLGLGNANLFSSPQALPTMTSNVTALSTGGAHACAIKNGAVYCWGWNNYGQLGDGTVTTNGTPHLTQATALINLNQNVSVISAGHYHTCAIQNGALFCWGYNGNGELGNGAMLSSSTPVAVSGMSANVVSVSVGDYHTCAIKTDTSLWCWGYDAYGQLGLNDASHQSISTPRQVVNPVGFPSGYLTGVSAVSTGIYSTCAIKNGALFCWGYNAHGEIGNGSTQGSDQAVAVSGMDHGVKAVIEGAYHTCAIQDGVQLNGQQQDGVEFCWGYNGNGQLGTGDTAGYLAPQPVVGMVGVSQIAPGGYQSSCAVKAGLAYCWGYNYYGQLGLGNGAGGKYTPQLVTNF